MKLRNKNGFITIYAMLAMMFFVVFVVVASVTASRKLKLQTEANNALIDIYNKNIESMNKTDETTIPIYTQAQFEYIATWIANISNDSNPSETEYIYINDGVYKLDVESYRNNYYKFELKTDLWLKGIKNEDEDNYPYIPENNNYHVFLKDKINIAQSTEHFVYLMIQEVGDTEYTKVLYGQIIEVSTAEDFIKIGTDEYIGKRRATKDATYSINNYINLEGVEYEGRPDFNGKIIGNGKIIDNLKINISNEDEDEDEVLGLFGTNTGIIDDLIFTNVEIDTSSYDDEVNKDLGIIAKTNGGTISNCTIQISNQTNNDYCLIDGDNKQFNNFGIIAGSNTGTISNCNVQAVKITRNSSAKFRIDYRN